MSAFAADVVLACAAFGAAVFCLVLSRRLARLGRSDAGLGASLAALAEQSHDLSEAVAEAGRRAAHADERIAGLKDTIDRAEAVARRLELLMAAADAPEPRAERPAAPAAPIFRRATLGAA